MKKVFFVLHDNTFHRYIYILIKFFLIEDYKVYIKFNFKFLKSLSLYSELLLKEKDVKLFCLMKPVHAVVISDKKNNDMLYISPDYFSQTTSCIDSNSYHVPISMHPLMYYNGLWNVPMVEKNDRLKSALFLGATSGYVRHSAKLKSIFNVTSREDLIAFLIAQKSAVIPLSHVFFENFSSHKSIVVADRKHVKVSQQELRATLYKYYFFIAASGFIMPLCHNLVESMSVGTIPIIEKEYASLLDPPLVHGINSIIYDDMEDMKQKINCAFELSKEVLDNMSNNVLKYYEENLTPNRVIKSIVSNSYNTLYLNAEEGSVKLLENV